MDFLANNVWAVWVGLAVLFMVLEIATTTLVSIWFVPSSLITALLSLGVKNATAQVLVFLGLSVVFVLFSKKFFRVTRTNQATNPNDLLIGKTGVVKDATMPTEVIVLVGDVHWRAVCKDSLAEGELVTVNAVNGNVLTVEKQNEKVKENVK